MKRLILTVFAALLVISGLQARKTTRKNLKVEAGKIRNELPADTINDNTLAAIKLAGFDKPYRSNYETVFVTNNSRYNICGIIIECNYTDAEGRQLHRRTVTCRCDIPSGQTRQLRFRSWDNQQSFYYRLSAKPRRSRATSFDVSCVVKAVITPSEK